MPIAAINMADLKVYHFIISLNLNSLSKYVYMLAITTRKGIIFVYLQDNLRKGVFSGK